MYEVSFSIHEASRATGVPVPTLKHFIKKGELPAVRVRRSLVLRRSTLDTFLAKYEVVAPDEDGAQTRRSNNMVIGAMRAVREDKTE